MTPNQAIAFAVAIAFVAFILWVELSRIVYAYRKAIVDLDSLLKADLIFRNPSQESPSYTRTKP